MVVLNARGTRFRLALTASYNALASTVGDVAVLAVLVVDVVVVVVALSKGLLVAITHP